MVLSQFPPWCFIQKLKYNTNVLDNSLKTLPPEFQKAIKTHLSSTAPAHPLRSSIASSRAQRMCYNRLISRRECLLNHRFFHLLNINVLSFCSIPLLFYQAHEQRWCTIVIDNTIMFVCHQSKPLRTR